MTQQHGKRIAIIENEFGAVNIDEDLVAENLRCTGDQDLLRIPRCTGDENRLLRMQELGICV